MKDQTQILNRLIEQLDSLISFMGLSHEEVFELLLKERIPWFGDLAEGLPDAYETYRKQVIHSALLLGYSYFESFLTDLLGATLLSRPTLLSQAKTLKYSEILASESKADILDEMVKKELHALLYKSMNDIVAELKDVYNFNISQEEEEELCKVSLLRNCIVHNSAHADARLAKYSGFQENEEFALSSEQVHDFGIMLRALVRRMCAEANANHNTGIQQ